MEDILSTGEWQPLRDLTPFQRVVKSVRGVVLVAKRQSNTSVLKNANRKFRRLLVREV